MSAALAGSILAPIAGGLIGNHLAQGDRERANELSQKSLEILNGIRIPTPEEQRIVLAELKSVGMYTPEIDEALTLQASKMNDVSTDPRLKQAQMNALMKLQEISDNDGLTMQDKAQLSQVQNEVNSNLKGNTDAIQQNMATRGMSGGVGELVSKQLAAQQAANRNSQQGLDVASMAQQRALQALMNGGQMAGQMQQTDFNQQSQVAQANDAISKFNTMNQQDVRSNNTANKNDAQKYNLGNQQRIADTNAGISNQQQMYNKELNQQYYQNQMDKAAAMSGQYANQANRADASAQRTAEMYAGVGSGLGKGAAAYDQKSSEDERLAKYGRKY